MKVYLIRHGQTDWNKEKKIQGSVDIELNEDGRKQAHKMGKELMNRNLPIQALYCSKLKRAKETAKILGCYISKEPIELEDLEEMNLGTWEGKTWEQIKIEDTSNYERWYQNLRGERTPEGESYEEVVTRANKVIENLVQKENKDFAVVTHGAVIMALLCLYTDTDFSDILKFNISNLGMAVVEYDPMTNTYQYEPSINHS